MKNLSGQEVRIEVGMVCRDTDGTCCHIRAKGRNKFIRGNWEKTIERAILTEDEDTVNHEVMQCWVCVDYHKPLGVDKNGKEVHYGDTIYSAGSPEQKVVGRHHDWFLLDVKCDMDYTAIFMAILKQKNPLRTQSEKTPEQIEEEKAIKLLTERGRIRDGKVIV